MSAPQVVVVKNVRFLTEEESADGRFRSDIHYTAADRWVISYEWAKDMSVVDSKAEVFRSAEKCLSWLRSTPHEDVLAHASRAADALAEALP